MSSSPTSPDIPDAARRRIDAAAILGKSAAQRNKPATDCPYKPGSTDPVERACALAWVRAYLKMRPPHGAVDYDDGEPAAE